MRGQLYRQTSNTAVSNKQNAYVQPNSETTFWSHKHLIWRFKADGMPLADIIRTHMTGTYCEGHHNFDFSIKLPMFFRGQESNIFSQMGKYALPPSIVDVKFCISVNYLMTLVVERGNILPSQRYGPFF
jgi:hypothetical protein